METWLILLLIFPLVCALIGYITNVVAVKMIFRPHDPVSVLGMRIQGVLPKHQRHFARLLSKIIVRQFMNTGDLVRSLNRPEVLDELEQLARSYAGRVIDEVRHVVPADRQALLTPDMVEMATNQIVAEVRRRAPDLVSTLSDRAQEVLRLEDVITEKVMGWGAQGLEKVIYQVSKRELDFIEYYGAVFGFALGLFQWLVLQMLGPIALPLVGILVGVVTNWLAIQMLFYPREPTLYLGFFEYQGLFPKRQFEMATIMGEIASKELIIPEEVFSELLERVVPDQIEPSTIERIESYARAQAPEIFQMVDGLVPEDNRPALRERIAASASAVTGDFRAGLVASATRHIDVDRMLEARLQGLAKNEFESLIRGLFEREEIYLIIYGGLLGGLIGGLQLLMVGWFGG
jgi:uncharacterized membrane protein YheB (UPF0754 family)